MVKKAYKSPRGVRRRSRVYRLSCLVDSVILSVFVNWNLMVAAALQGEYRLCEPHVGLLHKVLRGLGYLRRKKDRSECHVTRIADNLCRESSFPMAPLGSAVKSSGLCVFGFDLFALSRFRIMASCPHLKRLNSPGSIQTARDRKVRRERFLLAQFFLEVPVSIIQGLGDGKRGCFRHGQTKRAWSMCSPLCIYSRNNNCDKIPTSLDFCEFD